MFDKTKTLKTLHIGNDPDITYKNFKFNAKTPFLNWILHVKNKNLKYVIIVILAFLSSLEVLFFIKNSGLYSSGLRSITQALSFLTLTALVQNQYEHAVAVYNILFWFSYLIINIPLFIFARKKIGKHFAYLSMLFVILTTVFGYALSWIPNINHVMLFGNSIPGERNLPGDSDKNKFYRNGINILPFWYPRGDNASGSLVSGTDNGNSDIFNWNTDQFKGTLLFIYAFAHGFTSALINACVFMLGACTGGTDFISFYHGNKGKNLGNSMFKFSMISLFFSVIIGSNIPAAIIDQRAISFYYFFSATMVCSFSSIMFYRLFMRTFFSNRHHIKVTIDSQIFWEPIATNMIDDKYHRNLVLKNARDFKTGIEYQQIEIICDIKELEWLIYEIRIIDPKAFVAVYDVSTIDGYLLSQRYGDEDIYESQSNGD